MVFASHSIAVLEQIGNVERKEKTNYSIQW